MPGAGAEGEAGVGEGRKGEKRRVEGGLGGGDVWELWIGGGGFEGVSGGGEVDASYAEETLYDLGGDGSTVYTSLSPWLRSWTW